MADVNLDAVIGSESSRPKPSSFGRLGAAAAVALAFAVIYARSTQGYFFDDDFHWLVQSQAFAPANLFDLARYNHFYRPVIELYFFAGLSLFGCNAFPFHLASIGIHALTTIAVYGLARALRASAMLAWLAALFFAVQPGLTDAVTWIGAITDQLPALWYVLTIAGHVHVLRGGGRLAAIATFIAFALCHLTQESAATLLPMMLLTDFTFTAQGGLSTRLRVVAGRWRYYLPFAAVLAGFLVVAYIVNTRGYLVQEGHYRLGLHALPNLLNYIIWLYIGKRRLLDYTIVIAALALVVIAGTPRMRYAVAWVIVTLLPVSFFTWDDVPRYLYLPAAGFSLLVADLMGAMHGALARRLSRRVAVALTSAVVVVLAVRFAVFARKAADSFPARSASYERFVTELRRANPEATAGSTVTIEQHFLDGVPELYREPAARVGLCLPDLRLQMR